MTDIRKLMEDVSPLPWTPDIKAIKGGSPMLLDSSEALLATSAVNALPAVLEYMKGGHHGDCLWWQEFDGQRGGCTCGYDNLCKALG